MRVVRNDDSSGYSGVELIERLRNSDRNAMEAIYNNHRNSAMYYMKTMYTDEEILKDVYQDSMVIVSQKVLEPDFDLTCDFQGYINRICRNQLLNRVKDEQKQRSILSGDYLNKHKDNSDGIEKYNEVKNSSRPNIVKAPSEIDTTPLNIENIKILNSVKEKMKELSDKCYEIINRTYLLQETNEIVADEMGYKDKAVFKNIKSRCFKRLKIEALKLKIHS